MKNKYIWKRRKCYLNGICIGQIYQDSTPEWTAKTLESFEKDSFSNTFTDGTDSENRDCAMLWVESKADKFIQKLTKNG